MTKKINVSLIIIALLIFNVILIAKLMLVDIKSKGAECTLDPLIYGAKELQSQNENQIMCSCSLSNSDERLFFNDKTRFKIE